MSTIIGANNDPLASFTLEPGKPVRIWWYGFGEGGIGYNVGFPFPSVIKTLSNRVVADNHGMESVDFSSTGLIYTVDLHAEDSLGGDEFAVFRIEIGSLS